MIVSNALLAALVEVTFALLNFYIWILIAGAVLSWLTAFDIINPHNRAVRMIGDFIYRVTEPVLRPIRRMLPNTGGLDLAPLALIFLIMFIEAFLRHLVIG